MGTLDELDAALLYRLTISAALSGRWFEPRCIRLHQELRSIHEGYCTRNDGAVFMGVPRNHREMLAVIGVTFEEKPDDRVPRPV